MNAIECCMQVKKNGCQVFRERRDEPGQYDCKDYFSGGKHGWTALDAFSASAILAVHEKLNPENREKFTKLPLVTMAKVAFKLVA